MPNAAMLLEHACGAATRKITSQFVIRHALDCPAVYEDTLQLNRIDSCMMVHGAGWCSRVGASVQSRRVLAPDIEVCGRNRD